MQNALKKLSFALLIAALASPASAHVGAGEVHGFSHGFFHPLTGIDHILAMVAVGMFAAFLGGRALWLVPLSFVGMMGVAGIMGASGVPLPYVEAGIALSVVALGMIVAFEFKPPVIVAMALVGFFALFHGHAHGAELPEDASGVSYGAGFMVATALLHAAGIGIGLALGAATQLGGKRIAQLAGCVMALAGGALLTGAL